MPAIQRGGQKSGHKYLRGQEVLVTIDIGIKTVKEEYMKAITHQRDILTGRLKRLQLKVDQQKKKLKMLGFLLMKKLHLIICIIQTD